MEEEKETVWLICQDVPGFDKPMSTVKYATTMLDEALLYERGMCNKHVPINIPQSENPAEGFFELPDKDTDLDIVKICIINSSLTWAKRRPQEYVAEEEYLNSNFDECKDKKYKWEFRYYTQGKLRINYRAISLLSIYKREYCYLNRLFSLQSFTKNEKQPTYVKHGEYKNCLFEIQEEDTEHEIVCIYSINKHSTQGTGYAIRINTREYFRKQIVNLATEGIMTLMDKKYDTLRTKLALNMMLDVLTHTKLHDKSETSD
jgi:hypothetical protein